MWTDELILRLKKYIDGSRYFEVRYKDQKVYGMDLPMTAEDNALWAEQKFQRDVAKAVDEFDITLEKATELVKSKPAKIQQVWPLNTSSIYLEPYDDVRPDYEITPEETSPEDFTVLLLKPVEWTKGDPNWKEADPESWAEVCRHQDNSE